MPKELIADTDFFIALYKKDDANHGRALNILEEIGKGEYNLIITVLVYAEITTILSQRVSKNLARLFIKDIEETQVRIVQSSELLFDNAKKIFDAQSSKNVSFTDAMNIALTKEKGGGTIVSFDKDYKKNSLKRFKID